MAALHATAFGGAARWSATSFAQMLGQRGSIVATAADAFLLGRATAGEAELLTLLVAAHRRGEGVARGLLARFETLARAQGATDAFLEVASGNAPARALYAATGWAEAGRRPGYYAGGDALILRKAL